MTRLADRVKETSSTTGTGTLTLGGAVAGYRGFLAALGAGPVYYAIVHQSLAQWETGVGTLASGPDTLARTAVLASSNGGAAVNFSAGTKDVFCTAPAGAFAAKPSFLCQPRAAVAFNSNFPALTTRVGTHLADVTLAFDQTTDEFIAWRFVLPSAAAFTSAQARVTSRQAAAVTGTVGWYVGLIALAAGDPWDSTPAYTTVGPATVPGTAGHLLVQTAAVPITGWAAGKTLYAYIGRAVALDTCAEDAELMDMLIELA